MRLFLRHLATSKEGLGVIPETLRDSGNVNSKSIFTVVCFCPALLCRLNLLRTNQVFFPELLQ